MSSSTNEHSQDRKAPGLGKRVWQLLSIVMILLTPWVFWQELKEAYETGTKQEKSGTFTARLATAVKAQLDVLEKVDSGSLGFTYYSMLQSNECTWLFKCYPIRVAEHPNPLFTPIFDKHALEHDMEMALRPTAPPPPPTVSLPSFIKPHELPGAAGRDAKSGASASDSPSNISTNQPTIPAPQLQHLKPDLPDLSPTFLPPAPAIKTVATAPAIFTKLGPIWLPTLHTIRGTPHAFHETIIAIHDAGTWATAMYLSCALIWITLWLRKMPLMLYLLIFGGPLSIPLMVTLMQRICEGLLNLGILGCAVAAGMMALLPSTALALLVGLHHTVKAPGEFIEAVVHLKR